MENLIKFSDKSFVTQAVSYVLMVGFLTLCFQLHLVMSLITGLIVFLLITRLYNFFSNKVKTNLAHKITLLIVIAITLLIVLGLVLGLYFSIKVGRNNIQGLEKEILTIMQQIKSYLPAYLVGYIPDDLIMLQTQVLNVAHNSGSSLVEFGGHSAKGFVHSIIGMLLGAVVAFSFLHIDDEKYKNNKPFILALKERISIFANVFERVLFSQVKISAINTLLTALYILVVLPICQINLPYGKTLVTITFFVGLIPVIGNLITNTVIVIISLTISFKVAIASLVFLVLVHKLEYYINAKIVGTQIKTSIWEMLIAMFIMESMFGLLGVALAPVFYGYLKAELTKKQII